jgi:hypothetical protein
MAENHNSALTLSPYYLTASATTCDVWEPLLAIADAVGKRQPGEHDAALALSARSENEYRHWCPTVRDIKQAFNRKAMFTGFARSQAIEEALGATGAAVGGPNVSSSVEAVWHRPASVIGDSKKRSYLVR